MVHTDIYDLIIQRITLNVTFDIMMCALKFIQGVHKLLICY